MILLSKRQAAPPRKSLARTGAGAVDVDGCSIGPGREFGDSGLMMEMN
jgi:hypothetical protein